LLLQKPLDKTVKHGGGAKFTTADLAYQSFTRFIEHYRQCQQP
jgi:hypothetical protein